MVIHLNTLMSSFVGRMDGRTDGRMDGWTDSPCVLQDFVSSGSLRSRCPAPITATITKYQSSARVPMTISCLWATGWALEGFLCRIQGRNFDCMHISQWVDLDLFVQGTKKGQCPVKDGLCTSICPYIHLSPSRRPKQSYGGPRQALGGQSQDH